MTPLAHRIVKELTLPLSKRTFHDQTGLQRAVEGAHCFEVTEVHRLIEELRIKGFGEGHFDERTAFAPFPKFWIERCSGDGMRFGFLAEATDADELTGWFRFRMAGQSPSGVMLELGEPFFIRMSDFTVRFCEEFADEYSKYVGYIYAALAIINTPRLIGRRQHCPHAGLERALARAKGLVGKFPLGAWTEITLSVSDMMRRAGEKVHEGHYTGETALHWCRAHLRIRLGRLELVKAHERGNPAIGLKRSRYKLAA